MTVIDYSISRINDCIVISLHDSIDIVNANSFSQSIEKIINEGSRKIVLDFQDVAFISTTGIGAILKYKDKLEEKKGFIALVGVNEEIRNKLGILGIRNMVKIYDSLDEIG